MFAILSATLTMGNIDVNLSESGDATVAQNGPELKVVAVSRGGTIPEITIRYVSRYFIDA